MLKKLKRVTLFRVNRFQRNLFYPIIVSFFLGCIVSWLSMAYVLIGDYLASPHLYRFQKIIPILLSLTTVLMIVVVFWTLRISGRYFGAYERILKELDDIVSGRKKGTLKTRSGDVICEDLLKRINALIEQMQ